MTPAAPSHDTLAYLQQRWNREQAFHNDPAHRLAAATMLPTEPAHDDDPVLAAAGVTPGAWVLDLGSVRAI